VAQKSKPLPNDQEIVLNRIKTCERDKLYSSTKSMNQALQYYSMGLDILCVAYFLTSITIPDRQIGDMRQKR